ncbi:MAG: diadenylate cyclase [Candidatus Hydrothermarchaeales archaeon]
MIVIAMETVGDVIDSAVELAGKIKANAILVLTETGVAYDGVMEHDPDLPVIAATAKDETFDALIKKAMISTLNIDFLDVEKHGRSRKSYALKLMTRGASRSAQIEDAIVVSMSKGILHQDDVVVVIGSSLTSEGDSIFVYHLEKEKLDFALYEFLREVNIKEGVFEAVLNTALEIGKEGREGRLIGTAFLIGDSKNVMEKSKQMILNPFEGHAIGERIITSPDIKETIKELAQLDGAFVITEDGVIEAAGRYLTVDTSKIDVPRGLGTRHAAVAAMSLATNAIGITVSQSGGIVRIIRDGEVFMTIEPQRKISLRTESLKATFTKYKK